MITHDMDGSYQSKAFDSILADAIVKTPMRDNGIDMGILIKNLCGNFTVDGKKVMKHVHRTEESCTNRK